MINKRACDRCYRRKDKCLFQNHVDKCTSCLRSSSPCTNNRDRARQGRRPNSKILGPRSSVYIWDPEGDKPAATVVQVSHLPSRGNWTGNAFSRDDELNVSLTWGPLRLRTLEYQADVVEDPFDNPPPLKEEFYQTFQLFLFGPSFAPIVRGVYQYSHACSPILLNDILLATFKAAVLSGCQGTLSAQDQRDLGRGVICLRKLRTADICKPQDVLGVLVLGQTLAAFDFLTHNLGSISILRYALSSIEPYYAQLSKSAILDPVTIPPIFWDTVSCLFSRDVPIIRYIHRDSHIVNQIAGYCTTLLPILYDLCVESHAISLRLRSELYFPDGSHVTLQKITAQLVAWEPTVPPDFNVKFLRHEVLAMKAQASMYRLAGLLIAHRIQNFIGTLDEVAIIYANSIIAELRSYTNGVIPGTQLLNVSFPLLLAMFEVSDISHEIWNGITLAAANPAAVAQMSALVDYVWSRREAGFRGSLFELIDAGPDVVVFP